MFRFKQVRWLAVLAVAGAVALSAQELREEFHQSYPLSAGGRVSLKNVNGAVHITAWDGNMVRVDAVKRARTQEALDEARIEVDARGDAVDIRTRYPEGGGRRDAASVDYAIAVPRQAVLDKISTVNGGVTVEGVAGAVSVSTVNGKVEARGLQGDAKLSTVNGKLEAEFDQLQAGTISLNTVNGAIAVALPPDAGARLSAKTLHGSVESDFGLPVRRNEHGPGTEIETIIGAGGPDLKLRTVNGGINLRRR